MLLPVTFFNYSQGDLVLPRGIQAALNLVVIFLGATLAWWLSEYKVDSPDAKVVKAMGCFMLVTSAVFVPALFTVIWTLDRLNVLPPGASTRVGFGALTAMAGAGSLVFVWLRNLRDRRKEQASRSARRVAMR
jgi:hypothetical protein